MHVLDAAQSTVDQYPGGAESLSPRLGMSAAILRNKVNPNCPTNHLTLNEADRMMTITGDTQILQALAANQGCALVKFAPSEQGADGQAVSVVNQILELGIAEGDFTRAVHDAMADQVITPRELTAITNASLEDQRALLALVQRLALQVKQGPASAQ